MSQRPSFFRSEGAPEGEVLHPHPSAASNWGRDHMRGPAITALLARAVERVTYVWQELRPARATFELFRPARMLPSTTKTRIVRQGRRLALVDSALVQDCRVVARAQVLLIRSVATDASPIWKPAATYDPPPVHLLPDPSGQLYSSGNGKWTSNAQDHDNGLRKQVWQVPSPVVEGEWPSAFVSVAAFSDVANLVVNWGERGIEYINVDVTLSMARLPEPTGIGLAARERWEDSGVAVGSAVLFDRSGGFGSASVSALTNAHKSIAVGTALPS